MQASLRLIDQLEAEIDSCERELRALGAEHAYITNLMTVPGIGWVLAYAIASEIGDIARFASPKKLCGHTGLCPRVYQSGCKDRCGALAKNGPTYLRWALIEAAMHAERPSSCLRPLRSHHKAARQAARRQGCTCRRCAPCR